MNVWHWAPNRLTENLEFRTEILPSQTAERRVSYADAIQSFGFGYVLTPRVAEQMSRLYLSDPNQTFLVPEWPTATFARTGSLSLAETVIPVDDVVVYAVGQKVILGSGDQWEEGEVASIGATDITLDVGTASAYSGSEEQPIFVAPLIESICPSGFENAVKFPIRGMQMRFLSTAPIDIPANPYTLYDGRPYLDDGYSMFGDLVGGGGRASILFDTGFGGFEIGETEEYTRRTGTLSFFDQDYSERMRRRRFLHFMRGRDGEMWVTSGQPELALNGSVASNALTIDVQPVAAAADMVGTVINFTEGASSVTRVVSDAVDNDANSQTLTIAVPNTAFTTSAKLSFMNKCRFDTDNFEIQYRFSKDGLMSQFQAAIIEVL